LGDLDLDLDRDLESRFFERLLLLSREALRLLLLDSLVTGDPPARGDRDALRSTSLIIRFLY